MNLEADGAGGSLDDETGRKEASDLRGGDKPFDKSTVVTSGVAVTYGGVA
jgi:hypothetical protein